MTKAKKVNPVGGSGSEDGRDSAVTPEWLAKLIGQVEIDPCSNPRSHIKAFLALSLEAGYDGLAEDYGPGGHYDALAAQLRSVGNLTTAYINPPYARGQVIRWVRHYRHTRFIFCLRWDPRTKWFRELWPHCTHVWWPQEWRVADLELGIPPHPGRIEFEPPPGVTFSSNPFPHALYMRDPSPEMLARLAPHGILLSAQQIVVAAHEAGVQLGGDDTPRSKVVSGSGTRSNSKKRVSGSGKGVAEATKYGSNPLDGRTFCVCDQCGETVEWSNHWCRVRKLSQPS